jgi:crotonobetaine/carnitine-CoA ligase
MALDGRFLHDVLRTDLGVPDDFPLVTFAADDRILSKAELRDLTQRAAHTLRAAGVKPGDRLAIMLPNCVEYLELFLAASLVGAVVVHLHNDLLGAMLQRPLSLTQPRLIITGAAVGHVLACDLPVGSSVVVVSDRSVEHPAGTQRYDVLSEHEHRASFDLAAARSPSEPVCIYSSSGTTGPAKAVTLSHSALYAMADASQQVLGFGSSDVAYAVTPFYHANALAFMFLASAVAGARTVFAERFSVSGFWPDVARHGATRSSLIGSAAAMLAGQPPSEFDGGTLELVAAVPRPKNVEEFERRFGVTLTEFYGSTEANLPLGIPVGIRRLGSCGRLLDGWEAIVADAEDNELPIGAEGQLLVRPRHPSTVSSGYWGEPERTVEMWQNLWIHTGDLMRRDADGWFHFVDRMKDAIRVSGENVSSADVEHAITELLPGVDVAAFGVASDLGDQDIMILIVPEPGHDVSLDEVIERCRRELPYFAVPRYAELIDTLPRTPTNRVKKAELRARGVRETTTDFGRPRRGRSQSVSKGATGGGDRA